MTEGSSRNWTRFLVVVRADNTECRDVVFAQTMMKMNQTQSSALSQLFCREYFPEDDKAIKHAKQSQVSQLEEGFSAGRASHEDTKGFWCIWA